MFDPKKADFSNLGNEFYLGDMWQTTVFRALETGTAESNITAIDLTRAKGNEEYFFSVDRPFLFAAIDNQTGGILMIGTMTNPLKEDEYLSDEE
jgi:serpin B